MLLYKNTSKLEKFHKSNILNLTKIHYLMGNYSKEVDREKELENKFKKFEKIENKN
jgi:hypothetical protein